MKEYELLQDYKSPNSEIKKGARKGAAYWFGFFIPSSDGSGDEKYYNDWCDKYPDWFKPVKASLDEIVEETYFKVPYTGKASEIKEVLKSEFTRHLNTTLEEIVKEIENLSAKFKLGESTGANARITAFEDAISIIKSHIK